MRSPSITLPLADLAWRLGAAQPDERAPNAIAAVVPGCVHTDLMAAGMIPDPFLDTNELDVAWVADVDWTYSAEFVATSQMTQHDRFVLAFDGLDTFSTIEVNGVVIAETANMHRSYRFDIGRAVREGVNELHVTFASAVRRADALRAEHPGWPAASFGRPYNYARKMACSWGWDWGPWLATAGIWRPARIECWSGVRLGEVRPSASVDATGHGTVSVEIVCERATEATTITDVAALVTLLDPAGSYVASTHAVFDGSSDRTTVRLHAKAVERWWPHTHGAQPLYSLRVTLVDAACATLDTLSARIGFRSFQLDTSADEIGSAFTMVVNELAVFARGVNWIPEDPFPSRITESQVRERLQQAKAANVDVVRVWGGGMYESDTFYDICDELGLMVWQDFCFACAAYPEELLAAEVEAEARENVARLMPHPSLVLWNGNNENIWGWFDWGWQKELGDRAWGAGFYLDLLPRIVAEVDPSRAYWPGSPYSGSMTVAANADAHGCTHVWDVWNQLDFDRYRDHSSRFVSEFGWQAPPTWSTMRTSITDEPLTLDSPGMLHHQKAAHGNAKLRRGLRAHVGEPDGFDQWWWATQLMQARAVTTGIEHFRSLRGWCMGTIWWQLNDCWPATSWSVVDSGGCAKPAWYALRDAYRPRLLTVQPRGDALVLFAVNDSDSRWSAHGSVRRMSFAGEVIAESEVALDVEPGSLGSMELLGAIGRPGDAASELIVVDAGGERTFWWFLPDKSLGLEPPRLSARSAFVVDGDIELTVVAENLVRDLMIMPDRLAAGALCDRQLITLLPGEAATIGVHGAAGLSAVDLITPPALCTAYFPGASAT
jgi:beta-mannosidase